MKKGFFEMSFKIKKSRREELNTSFDLINIRIKIRSKIFSGSGDLKIKCTAAIDPIYWRSSEESIQVIMIIRSLLSIMGITILIMMI